MQLRLSVVKFPVQSSMLGVSDNVVHLKRSSCVELHRQIAHGVVYMCIQSKTEERTAVTSRCLSYGLEFVQQ